MYLCCDTIHHLLVFPVNFDGKFRFDSLQKLFDTHGNRLCGDELYILEMFLQIGSHTVRKCVDLFNIGFECQQHLHIVPLCRFTLFTSSYHREYRIYFVWIVFKYVGFYRFAGLDTLTQSSTGNGDDTVHDGLFIEFRHELTPLLSQECCEDRKYRKGGDNKFFCIVQCKFEHGCVDTLDGVHQWRVGMFPGL